MELRIDAVIEEIRSHHPSFIGLQLPEGLKTKARDLADQIEGAVGCQVVILGDPCYGACDLKSFEGLDLLVHVGHTPIPDLQLKMPTVFLEVRIDFDVHQALQGCSERIAKRVGLIATAQHLHLLPETAAVLQGMGCQVLIGKGDARTAAPGQVIGCNVTSALAAKDEVDQYIFLGSGYFHPLAVSLGTGVPVISIDPYRGAVYDIQEMKEKVIRQRYAALAKARDANDWLVLVCDKPGQRRMEAAKNCLRILHERGMKANMVMFNEIRPEALLPYRAAAAVSTACPRLAIDDGPHYPIPLLTPWELEMVLGLKEMDDYRLDQILEGDTPG
jgi:2-(3-amino-3-carboxypropyl)histidine synthase